MCFLFALLFTLATGRAAWSANPVSYVGDFNGDGWPDVLLQPVDASGQVQIILADGTGNLTIPGQTWSADYLGLHWSADTSQVVVGDFTGTGRDDVLLQPLEPDGTGAVLLSDANGQFHSVAQLIANPYMGLDWSAASHHILVGDFTGNGRDDVLLQTSAPGGMNLIAEPNAQGVFNTTGQSWPDGYLGLQWSTQQVTLYVGDFTGHGQSDLLVQVNDPVSDTEVPAYALLLADANGGFTQINQSWGVSAFGADWSPATHTLSIQDVTGTGMDDIVLTAKDPSGTNYLFLGNQTGTFSKPDLTWTGTESAKTAWANKMAAEQSINVTDNTTQSSPSKSTVQTTAQPRAMITQATQTANAVGDMGGQSAVNGGAATYTIPIVVPPGRAGMQPNLSLDYSSRGGNGDLGMGWSLSGASAITRCPATYAQDGYTQGVTYSATTDRLCLDGQHLIAVSGTYGQSGSVYRTELDSLVRVTLTGGNVNSASATFEVDYENGRKAYYGTSSGTNTQFVASGAAYPLVWAIAEEVDASGNNSIVYNYQAYGSGEYHIASIVYSGTANRAVDFSYAARPDPSSVWLAGGLTRQTQLLTEITTNVQGNEVRQWSLNYVTSPATGRSLLQSVQACGYALSSGSLSCLPPDTFNWQDTPLSFGSPQLLTLPTVVASEAGGDSGTVSAQTGVSIDKDFDGDGQNELHYKNPYAAAEGVFWINNPNNYIDETNFFSTAFIGQDEDFLSDGLADAIGDSGGVMAVAYCTSQPNCTNAADFTTTSTGIPYVNASLATGQFAGDGLPDVVADETVPGSSNHAIYLYPNTTTANGAPQFNTAGIQLAPLTTQSCVGGNFTQSFAPIGDLDGNGIPDLLISNFCPAEPVAVAFINNTSGTAGGTTATVQTLSALGITLDFSQPQIYFFADINGDGLKDFVFVSDNGNPSASATWHYQINEGGTFGPVVDTGVVAGNSNFANGMLTNYETIQVGDFTDDGKDELLVPVSRVSTYCLILKVMEEGVWQDETYCGDTMIQKAGAGDDHSVYQFQVLKFAEQPNGSYVPTWVSNGGSPVSVNAEANTVAVGDLYGTGLTDVFMLSSRWFTNGFFNDSSVCSNSAPPCAPVLAEGYYTMSPPDEAPDLMTGAVNGLGVQASWAYHSLTDLKKTGAYSVDRPCSTTSNASGQIPEYYCFSSSMWVVSAYSVSNDTGSLNNYTYSYKNAVYDNEGRGFQGFSSITTSFSPITTSFSPANDSQDATTAVRNYRQDFPFSGSLINETVTQTSTGNVLSTISNTWPNGIAQAAHPTGCLSSNKVYWPQLQQSVVTKNSAGGENISTTTTNYAYDGYGNTTQVAASTVDSTGTYGTTTNYLNNSPDCTNWWLDKFGEKTVALSVSYATPIVSQPTAITRTANYTYTSLRKIYQEYDDQGTAFEKDTTYGYDSYGNTNSVQISSGSTVPAISAITPRTVSSDYSGTNSYFADAITNAAGQTTHINPDPDTGQPLTATDPNGVVTTYSYDAFGRKTSEQITAPVSLPATIISYTAPAAVCPSGTVYSVITARTGFPGRTACYDLLNQVLRTATDSFTAGQPVLQDTSYDVLGRVIFTSEPYFSGQSATGTTINQYDVLNRVIKKTDAEGVVTAYGYNGLTATATTTSPDSPAFTTVTTTNSLGKLLSTVDAKGSDTEFRYDAQGNPTLIQDTADHQTLATYNLLGQKTAVSDPDMGNWSYVYDVLGNLKQQTDAKSQVMTQTFDLLNRMTSRTQSEGVTNWTYDTCTNGVGKLCTVAQYSGYQKTYSYDGDGRVSNVAEQINGTAYNTSTGYDADGRVSTVSYPAGVTDQPPTANAGSNQTVLVGATVQLNGTGSSEPGGIGKPLIYQWTQTGGQAPMSLSSATSATASFTATTAGVYTFQLAVSDGLLTSSATTSITVQPAVPGTLSINESTSTNGSYIVSWGSSTGAATYDLLESTDGGASFTNLGTATSPDSLTGKGSQTSNITYTYEAEGCANSVCGPPSDSASVLVTLPPTAPSSISLPSQSQGDGSFSVSWSTSTGVSPAYTVQMGQYVDGSSGGIIWHFGGCSSTGTSCTITGESDGTYYARVAACNQTACSGWTQAANTINVWHEPAPAAPSLGGPSQTTDGTIPLNWSAPTYAASYQLYWSHAAATGPWSAWTEVYNGGATSYTMSVLKVYKYNLFYVVACDAGGCSGSSNEVEVIYNLEGGCKTCAPTGAAQTPAPSPSTAPAPGTSSPSASTPPSGTGPLASAAVSPVGATVPVAMAATPILRKQNIIPAAIPVLPTLGTPYLTAGSSLAALAPAGASHLTLHDIQGSTSAAGAGVTSTQYSASFSIASSLPSAGESGSEGDQNAPVSYSAAHSTQHPARSISSWHYGLPEYLADADMRLEPVSSTTTQVGLTVLYTYTNTGYLQQLSNAVYPSQVFWTANSEDAFGQITQETYGNGIVSNIAHADPLGRITGITSGSLQNLSYGWDALGNLTSRSDTVHGASEAFQYDILNRLTSAQVTDGSGVQPAVSYSYDALGDITYKSDTGTYTYGGGAGPHAVTSISGPAGGSYGYDADGNMTNRNGTVITWNSDNLPTQITESSSNASSFAYAPDKHRYYQSAEINGVSETTVYAGVFETVTTGGVTTYRYHLSADSREVAEVDLSNSGSTVNETVSYVLSDHLGSVDVVQTINAATGALVSTTDMSFSAFGNRREVNTWLPPVTQAETQADHQANRYGFTHQEMLDNVGIIHMNGRIYDPNLGRFLSVDPVFEFPTNTQSLNPYSYVLNNPLSMTDPTGYVADSCGTGQTSCPDNSPQSQSTTVHVSYTPTGSHIAMSGTLTATSLGNGNYAVTASNTQLAQAFSAGAQAMFGNSNGTQSSSQGPGTGSSLGKSAQDVTNPGAGSIPTSTNAATGSQAQAGLNAPKNLTDGLAPEQLLHSYNMGGFVNPTGGGVRDDATGGGYFDSQRLDPDGTVRLHMATDFLATPGQDVEAPISGKVRNLIVYSEKFTKADPRLKQFRGVAIKGVDEYGFPTGYSAKLFYVSPTPGIAGRVVHSGDVVGTSQNRAQFTPGMENHVHMELYLFGRRVDPLDYIRPNY